MKPVYLVTFTPATWWAFWKPGEFTIECLLCGSSYTFRSGPYGYLLDQRDAFDRWHRIFTWHNRLVTLSQERHQ